MASSKELQKNTIAVMKQESERRAGRLTEFILINLDLEFQ